MPVSDQGRRVRGQALGLELLSGMPVHTGWSGCGQVAEDGRGGPWQGRGGLSSSYRSLHRPLHNEDHGVSLEFKLNPPRRRAG